MSIFNKIVDIFLWKRGNISLFYVLCINVIFLLTTLNEFLLNQILITLLVVTFFNDIDTSCNEYESNSGMKFLFYISIVNENFLLLVMIAIGGFLIYIIQYLKRYTLMYTFISLFDFFSYCSFKYNLRETESLRRYLKQLACDQFQIFNNLELKPKTIQIESIVSDGNYLENFSFYQLKDFEKNISKCNKFFHELIATSQESGKMKDLKISLKRLWDSQKSHRKFLKSMYSKRNIVEVKRHMREVFLLSFMEGTINGMCDTEEVLHEYSRRISDGKSETTHFYFDNYDPMEHIYRKSEQCLKELDEKWQEDILQNGKNNRKSKNKSKRNQNTNTHQGDLINNNNNQTLGVKTEITVELKFDKSRKKRNSEVYESRSRTANRLAANSRKYKYEYKKDDSNNNTQYEGFQVFEVEYKEEEDQSQWNIYLDDEEPFDSDIIDSTNDVPCCIQDLINNISNLCDDEVVNSKVK